MVWWDGGLASKIANVVADNCIYYIRRRAKGENMVKVGDKAPDFTVTDHTGKEVSLGDYAGKTVVLWFYPRASTGG